MKPEDLEALRARLRYLLYAERVTRILCRRSGVVDGWRWLTPSRAGKPGNHRAPPLPFHSTVHRGGGTCRVCGQPIYGGGSFRSFAGPVSTRLTWHTLCTASYFLMTKPADQAAVLILRQGERCAITGDPIPLPYVHAEVDHDVPLFRVARDHLDEPWHELLRFWMTGNLQAVNRRGHLVKCAEEARERAGRRAPTADQEALL